MEIQTIWENGVFKPVKPLRLKRLSGCAPWKCVRIVNPDPQILLEK